MTDPADAEQAQWMRMSLEILGCAINDDHQAAARTLHALNETGGGDACLFAVFCWMDVFIASRTGPIPDMLVPIDLASGERKDIDTIRPSGRWAIRMLHARARRDTDQMQALLEVIPPEQFSDHVFEMLMLISQNLLPGPMMRRR